MKVVIEINEQYWNEIRGLTEDEKDFCQRMISEGTPLPKGHGRLIDADAIIDTLGCSDRDIYVKACIEEDAPTIIEADKSESTE